LTEIEVEHAGTRLRIVRERPGGAGASRPGTAPAESRPAEEGTPVPSHLVTMEAPMVGTFYRSPSPEAPPYVSEGDLVKQGQVVCIIEAMKLMNEIEAKTSGRVARILVENAQPVEYGQPLLLIEPRG